MTDKQIIIDGCDVSGCEFAPKEIGWCNNGNLSSYCKDNPNCYYKQLKLAEQTVEACHKYQAELEDKLEAKEQECERLKEEIKTKTYHWEQCTKEILKGTKQFVDRMEKAEKTLTEIKEIAETAAKCMYATYSDDYTEGYSWLGRIILQKISECEEQDGN